MDETNPYVSKYFSDLIRKIVQEEINKQKLNTGCWQLGKVDSVISSTKLSVLVGNATTAQTIPCNPDITFNIGDEIFVIFLNHDSANKFALCKRGI